MPMAVSAIGSSGTALQVRGSGGLASMRAPGGVIEKMAKDGEVVTVTGIDTGRKLYGKMAHAACSYSKRSHSRRRTRPLARVNRALAAPDLEHQHLPHGSIQSG